MTDPSQPHLSQPQSTQPQSTPGQAAPPTARRLAVQWLGRVSYPQSHAHMTAALAARIGGTAPDTLLLSEPEPVITLGRRRDAHTHVLAAGSVPVIQVERGGDVTFHGPGQLIGYPIVALQGRRQDLHAWLRTLEQVVIDTVGAFGLRAGRDPRNSGVWVEGQKICAVGIACRRWVTWHGLALNINIDLDGFQRVQPCGMDSALVTNMAAHLDPCPSMEQVRHQLVHAFTRHWNTLSEP